MNTATAQVIDHRLLALNVLRANLASAMAKLDLQRKGLIPFPEKLSLRTHVIMAIIDMRGKR